jgi:hypothetical protein
LQHVDEADELKAPASNLPIFATATQVAI